jgi:hypothetical protein
VEREGERYSHSILHFVSPFIPLVIRAFSRVVAPFHSNTFQADSANTRGTIKNRNTQELVKTRECYWDRSAAIRVIRVHHCSKPILANGVGPLWNADSRGFPPMAAD